MSKVCSLQVEHFLDMNRCVCVWGGVLFRGDGAEQILLSVWWPAVLERANTIFKAKPKRQANVITSLIQVFLSLPGGVPTTKQSEK
jgi:hypothetical protein